MKSKEVYNDVNFDYPRCGGLKIKETKNNYMVEIVSNMSDRINGRIILFSKYVYSIDRLLELYHHSALQYEIDENPFVRLLRKGDKVY